MSKPLAVVIIVFLVAVVVGLVAANAMRSESLGNVKARFVETP